MRPSPEPDDAPATIPAQPATPAHDPLTCGLDDGDTPPTCPGCVVESRVRSAVGDELARICRRFEVADRKARSAETATDRTAALTERDEAAGIFFAAETGLADLCCLLLRTALGHRPDALQALLASAIRAELEPIAAAVLRLEARR